MLTGVVTELTDSGPCHMLLFTSPRMPGSHYKVQVDAATAARVRTLITSEAITAEMSQQIADQITGADDEEEEQPHDQFGRN